jgi:uncharacterized protein YcfL
MKATGIIMIIMLILVGCSTHQPKSDFGQAGKEIEDILRSDGNLTDSQKVVLRQAVSSLRSADQVQRQNSELQKELVKTSKDAGAGRLVYLILGVVGLVAGAVAVSKVARFFKVA